MLHVLAHRSTHCAQPRTCIPLCPSVEVVPCKPKWAGLVPPHKTSMNSCQRVEPSARGARSIHAAAAKVPPKWHPLLKPSARRIPVGAGIPHPMFWSRTEPRPHGQLRRISLSIRLERAGRNYHGKNGPARQLAMWECPAAAQRPRLRPKMAWPDE